MVLLLNIMASNYNYIFVQITKDLFLTETSSALVPKLECNELIVGYINFSRSKPNTHDVVLTFIRRRSNVRNVVKTLKQRCARTCQNFHQGF